MKQLLFLLLFPCLCVAQYTGNAGQKITLGEQTTADGLVYRGNAADTVAATLKITKTNKSDTSAFLLLDTINNVFLKYNIGTTYWTRLNILPTDTASMLANYWRSGRFSGTLPVANGGTGSSSYLNGAITYSNGTSLISDTSKIYLHPTDNRLLIGTSNRTDPISGFSKFKVLDGDYIFSINRNDGEGFVSVANTTNNIKGFVGHTNPDDGFVFGSYSNHQATIRTSNTNRLRIKNDGKVYIAGNTDRGAYNLQVNGTGVWGEGAYYNGSDANIKENIVDLDSSLNIVNNLKPVSFNYINTSVNNDTKHLGFIAQDVYQILENKDYLNSIVRSDSETLSIAYSNLIPLLTKAIQEQTIIIKQLEDRIKKLEEK